MRRLVRIQVIKDSRHRRRRRHLWRFRRRRNRNTNTRNGFGSQTLAPDPARGSVAIEKQPDASRFDRSPDGREAIRDRRSVAVLEIAHGGKPDASAVLLRSSQPPASNSALLRARVQQTRFGRESPMADDRGGEG
jgi:hypothetical protein